MNKIKRLITVFMIIAVFVSACNLPEDVSPEEATAIVGTLTALALPQNNNSGGGEVVVPATATFTPISAPPTATFTPIPLNTNTPVFTATSNCNVAQFIADVTIPDGTVFAPSAAFVKKWRIKNIGTCAWNGYAVAFDSGDSMGGPASKPLAAVNPGQEVEIELNLTAPAAIGNYRGYWRLVTNGNVLVPVVSGYQGKSFYVDIKVQAGGGATATATNTATAVPAAFAVTSVSVSVDIPSYTGSCAGGKLIVVTYTAQITANGPGSVTYRWDRSDGATPPTDSVTFAAAGTKTVNSTWSTTWNPTDTGTIWKKIYVDNPNHQLFPSSGETTIKCDP